LNQEPAATATDIAKAVPISEQYLQPIALEDIKTKNAWLIQAS
jgi:hypothetical protein